MEATASRQRFAIGTPLVQQDEQFLKWMVSQESEKYWVLDREGKRMKLKRGWSKVQEEYDYIKAKCENQITDETLAVIGK
jgi:hypothetical protein